MESFLDKQKEKLFTINNFFFLTEGTSKRCSAAKQQTITEGHSEIKEKQNDKMADVYLNLNNSVCIM